MNCFECDGTMKLVENLESIVYRNKNFKVSEKKYLCACGEELLLTDNYNEIKAKKREIDKAFTKKGIMSPSRIKYIRTKKIMLTQKEASNLFGLSDTAFSRYERGEVNASQLFSKKMAEFAQGIQTVEEYKSIDIEADSTENNDGSDCNNCTILMTSLKINMDLVNMTNNKFIQEDDYASHY